jgi:hypothetical protein
MVIEMLLNDDINFFCSNDFKISKGNNVIMYIIEIKKNKFKSFHLNKISIKYEFSKLMFL